MYVIAVPPRPAPHLCVPSEYYSAGNEHNVVGGAAIVSKSISKLESDWSARARSQTYFGFEAQAELAKVGGRSGYVLILTNQTSEWLGC